MPLISNKLSEERFLIPMKIILAYVIWKVFHHFVSQPHNSFHMLWEDFCVQVGSWYATSTGFLLSLFGMWATADGINVNLVTSNKQIWVQEHCLAIPAMVVFTGAVLSFKGTWKSKIRFIFTGLVGIMFINLLRLIFVSVAWVYLSAQFFNLHHTFIYAAATYGFIFLMIVWWVKRTHNSNVEDAC
jgi:exosortase/archaeosortase family protein